MHSNLYNEKNDFFSIITVSLLFHFIVIATLVAAVLLKPAKKDPPPIPFFEMINMAPSPAPVSRPEPRPVSKPEPKPEAKPEPKPEPKSEPKPVLKPEPKPVPPAPPTPTAPAEPAPASMDMPMDLPSDMEMPALQAVGVRMDSELQNYLNRVYALIYQNFNPPPGTEIAKGTKSSVHFQIARNGDISAVILRSSSGNGVWDQLATRAVRITKKAPPLPHSYTAESLPLIFDFREK